MCIRDRTLPVSGEIVMLMLLFSLFLTRKQYLKVRAVNAEKGLIETKNREEDAEEITLTDFIRRNKVFFAINIGVVGVYFSNSVLNNYMMQIVADVGGDSEDMGRVLAVKAFLEIPTMAVSYTHLREIC